MMSLVLRVIKKLINDTNPVITNHLSKDGSVQIHFYYDDTTGNIASYFPIL